jgi:hypothetical protein
MWRWTQRWSKYFSLLFVRTYHICSVKNVIWETIMANLDLAVLETASLKLLRLFAEKLVKIIHLNLSDNHLYLNSWRL